MIKRPHRSRKELEDALLALQVVQRRVEIVRQVVLLAIALAFAVVTIICALHGYHWPTLATGGSSVLTAATSAVSHYHKR